MKSKKMGISSFLKAIDNAWKETIDLMISYTGKSITKER